MPVRRVAGGYQWGTSGKVYKTREEAERQGRAISAARRAAGTNRRTTGGRRG